MLAVITETHRSAVNEAYQLIARLRSLTTGQEIVGWLGKAPLKWPILCRVGQMGKWERTLIVRVRFYPHL